MGQRLSAERSTEVPVGADHPVTQAVLVEQIPADQFWILLGSHGGVVLLCGQDLVEQATGMTDGHGEHPETQVQDVDLPPPRSSGA